MLLQDTMRPNEQWARSDEEKAALVASVVTPHNSENGEDADSHLYNIHSSKTTMTKLHPKRLKGYQEQATCSLHIFSMPSCN